MDFLVVTLSLAADKILNLLRQAKSESYNLESFYSSLVNAMIQNIGIDAFQYCFFLS